MILVTGHRGYVGSVLTRLLSGRGIPVVGVDAGYYEAKGLPELATPARELRKDVRDMEGPDIDGVTGVVHLAALSNDPIGELDPLHTDEINRRATFKLASLCKQHRIPRFLFASSCSIYGMVGGSRPVIETDPLDPRTAYARSKAGAETDLLGLASEEFHPTLLRSSTVYGPSPRLRLDLVVNNLVAQALLTGEINIMSDGTPWRPLIHVEDLCRVFAGLLQAPLPAVHARTYNVGAEGSNYQVRDIGRIVAQAIPEARLSVLGETGPDERSYRVDFSALARDLPDLLPARTLVDGVKDLIAQIESLGLDPGALRSARFLRILQIKELTRLGLLDGALRIRDPGGHRPWT